MNKKSITYYCGGKKTILELLVSLYTLRKHYNGDIVVAIGETSLPYLDSLLDSNDFMTVIVPDTAKDKTAQDHWSARWKSMKMTNVHDKTMHFDCDNIVTDNFDDIWNLVYDDKEWITSLYHFPYWTSKKHKSKQIKTLLSEFRKIIPDFCCDEEKFTYTELGLFGYNKGWPYFDEVSKYCKIVKNDQAALSFVLMSHESKIKFIHNFYYVNRVKTKFHTKIMENGKMQTSIWHCKRVLRHAIWWKYFLEARKKKFLSLHDNEYIQSINRSAYKILVDKTWKNKILNPYNLYNTHGKIAEIIPQNE